MKCTSIADHLYPALCNIHRRMMMHHSDYVAAAAAVAGLAVAAADVADAVDAAGAVDVGHLYYLYHLYDYHLPIVSRFAIYLALLMSLRLMDAQNI